MWPWRTLRSQVAHRRRQPGPGAQLASRGEAADVADLGDQRHGRQPTDPGQDLKRLDPGVGLGQSCDLAFQPADRGGQGVQQPTTVLHDRACGRRELEAGQPGPPGTGPQDLVLPDPTIGQHRMHPVLQAGRQADQGGPMTQQRPQLADLLGRDPGLGQQISTQQLRQRGRIHLVVLQPGRGDRLAAAGMDQVRLQLQLLQQLDQPPPAVGGLQRHRGARRQRAKDRHQLGRIVGEVAVALLDAGVVHDGDLGTLAVHVHPDVDTHVGLLPRARRSRSLGCRAEQGTGARPT
jgi:hypothetical protein